MASSSQGFPTKFLYPFLVCNIGLCVNCHVWLILFDLITPKCTGRDLMYSHIQRNVSETQQMNLIWLSPYKTKIWWRKNHSEISLDETITTFSLFPLKGPKYTLPYRFLKYSQSPGRQLNQLREPHSRRLLTQEPSLYSSSQTYGSNNTDCPTE